jgi:CubicO group peptidase (beta-lactamase class C family)
MTERFAAARRVLMQGIETGAMPGATVCVYADGACVWDEALGTTDGQTPVQPATRYDLASLTKPLATGATLLTLVEDGTLALMEPADDAAFPGITLHHLLTHTSGLPSWTPCYERGEGKPAALAAIHDAARGEPGGAYAYSCLGFIVLADRIERALGQRLDRAAQERVFAPLGLDTLTFAPGTQNVAPTVSAEGPGKDAVLLGAVHDGNARAIGRIDGAVAGNAGLFGTARDVARFGEALRRGTFLSAPTRARVFANQSTPAGHTFLFFGAPNPLTPTGDLLSDRAVGHSGFTGTVLTIDPVFGLTVALLTNAVFGDGKGNFLRLRRRFLNTVAAIAGGAGA